MKSSVHSFRDQAVPLYTLNSVPSLPVCYTWVSYEFSRRNTSVFQNTIISARLSLQSNNFKIFQATKFLFHASKRLTFVLIFILKSNKYIYRFHCSKTLWLKMKQFCITSLTWETRYIVMLGVYYNIND